MRCVNRDARNTRQYFWYAGGARLRLNWVAELSAPNIFVRFKRCQSADIAASNAHHTGANSLSGIYNSRRWNFRILSADNNVQLELRKIYEYMYRPPERHIQRTFTLRFPRQDVTPLSCLWFDVRDRVSTLMNYYRCVCT